MKAEDMEMAYQKIMFGYDAPEVMWILGKTLKGMIAHHGGTRTTTNDGLLIADDEMYCVTRKGIWLVD